MISQWSAKHAMRLRFHAFKIDGRTYGCVPGEEHTQEPLQQLNRQNRARCRIARPAIRTRSALSIENAHV